MIIGRVFQNNDNNTFTFASSNYYSDKFVETHIDDNDGSDMKIISKVLSVNAINKRFNNPDFIRYIEEHEVFSDEALYLYIMVEIACIDKRNNVVNQYYPHYPGQKVYKTDINSVKLAYDLNNEGIEIGYLENIKDEKICLEMERIFNPHLTVLGRTGSGKTYFISHLIPKIEDSLVYIFSPTDEYNSIYSRNRNFKLFGKKDIFLNFQLDSLSYYYGLNQSEERILALISVENNKVYSNKDLIALIQEYYVKKTSDKRSFHQMTFLENSENISTPDIDEIQFPQYALTLIEKLKKKNLKFFVHKKIDLNSSAIFDLSDIAQSEQECILNSVLYQIYIKQKSTNTDKRKKCYIFLKKHITIYQV